MVVIIPAEITNRVSEYMSYLYVCPIWIETLVHQNLRQQNGYIAFG